MTHENIRSLEFNPGKVFEEISDALYNMHLKMHDEKSYR